MKKKILLYIGIYTLFFAAGFLIVYSPFIQKGLGFVATGDGRVQHFPFMVYTARYVRQILLNTLKGKLAIPLFDISIGAGGDVFGTLIPNGALDPLYLLTVFLPTKDAEITYIIQIILHLYLAGISFTYLCVYFHKRVSHTLIGSLIYCLSGYAISFSVIHPWFINPMIILPLMIVGLDKVIRKQRPYLLIFSTLYCALCGYYHLYMISLMLGVYALVRFFDIYHENRWREFFFVVVRSLGAYFAGLCLSAVVFLPSIFNYLFSGRSGHTNYQGPYALSAIRAYALKLIAPPGSQTCMAMAAIVLLALVLLLCSPQRRSVKIFAVVTVLSLFSSIVGLVMNGFQYSVTRFSFVIALAMAYTVVEMLPELLDMSGRNRVISMMVICGYILITVSFAPTRRTEYLPVGAIFLALTLIVLTITFSGGSAPRHKARTSAYLRTAACLLLVVVNVGINGVYKFAPDQANGSKSFEAFGYEITRLENAPERELEPYLLKNPDGRADSSSFLPNSSMPWHIPTLLFYNSSNDAEEIDFWQQVENTGSDISFYVRSTDQCTAINTLLSVKYHVETEKNTARVPYGYKEIGQTDDYIIYENEYALPWGYTYDTSISYDELNALNGLEKQEAMLQAVALEGSGEAPIPMRSIRFDAYKLPYDIVCKNCSWEDGALTVTKANAAMTLQFDMPEDVEGYVRLSKLDMTGSGVEDMAVQVDYDGVRKKVRAASELYRYYVGREDYLFNLGYSETARNELTITFPEKGEYRLDDIELYALPMNSYPERVEALRAEPLENIQWGTNSLTGTVDLSRDKILCVSVPYSKGWTATVDGEEVEILKGNYMFMCIPLTAGHHDIKFHYCSPGLKLGAALTVCSAGIVIWMLVRDKKKRAKGNCQ